MRSHLRLASVVGALGLGVVAMAPAVAAAHVAQSGANAISVSLAGNKQGTGNVTATNDGAGEKKTGETSPPISVLKGQSFFNGGVLAQQATATASGHSAACAGVAGSGGSVVQIGDSSCLKPGVPVNAALGSLDISKMVVADPQGALAGLNGVQPVITELANVINTAIAPLSAQFGNLGLIAGFGAVQGRCTASPGAANGDAVLTDAKITLNLPPQAPQQSLTLLNLPVHPKPNTHLTTDLSQVLDLILDAVKTDLTTSLDAQLSPLKEVIDPIEDQIVNNVVKQIETNLAPLEENLLDVTLNKQARSPGAIKVSAVDMQVLPAAEAQLGGASLAAFQIANVACGPNGRVVVAAPEAPAPAALPTAVSAGLATAPGVHAPGDDSHNGIVLAAFAIMLTGGTALVVFRRLRARPAYDGRVR